MKTNDVLKLSAIVALSGVLFGFDTVVISGADQQLQLIWDSSELFHGFVVMGIALWGTVIGALFGGIPVKRIGRKQSLIWIAVLYFISAIGSAMATGPFVFALFRLIGGLGIGASTIAAPAYISEISASNQRGQLVALYQFSIVLGVLLAMLSNYLLNDIGPNAWRWMLGVETLPAILFLILVFRIPQSPRWLLLKGRIEEARILKERFQLDLDIDSINKAKSNSEVETIFHKKYRRSLLLVLMIALFNQFSGINAILYYAPRIFELAGLEKSNAFLGGVWIGLVNLVFTIIGMSLIDKYGRKQLLYIGSIGYIFSLVGVAMAFYNSMDASLILMFLLFFIASHAIGQGTVIWVFMAELFPTALRSAGQAFGSSVHWILAALIPSLIPILFLNYTAVGVFGFFAFCMVLQLLWVYKSMPETKGLELEEIESVLS